MSALNLHIKVNCIVNSKLTSYIISVKTLKFVYIPYNYYSIVTKRRCILQSKAEDYIKLKQVFNNMYVIYIV